MLYNIGLFLVWQLTIIITLLLLINDEIVLCSKFYFSAIVHLYNMYKYEYYLYIICSLSICLLVPMSLMHS